MDSFPEGVSKRGVSELHFPVRDTGDRLSDNRRAIFPGL